MQYILKMNLFLIFLRVVDALYTCFFGFNESPNCKLNEFEASVISEDTNFLIKSNIKETKVETQLETKVETQLETKVETQLETKVESQREDQFEILTHDIIENYDSSLSNQLI